MPDAADRDLYQRFELEVRMPARRLLIDAFLPGRRRSSKPTR